MAWLLAIPGLLLVLALQTTLAAHLALGGVPPDLVLVGVIVLGLRAGPGRGGAAGIVSGLLLDLLHGTRLGLFALAGGLAGWWSGEAARRLDPERGLLRTWLAVSAAALHALVVAGAWYALDRSGVNWAGALHHIALAAVYDGSLAAAIYRPVASWGRRRGAPRSRMLGLGRVP